MFLFNQRNNWTVYYIQRTLQQCILTEPIELSYRARYTFTEVFVCPVCNVQKSVACPVCKFQKSNWSWYPVTQICCFFQIMQKALISLSSSVARGTRYYRSNPAKWRLLRWMLSVLSKHTGIQGAIIDGVCRHEISWNPSADKFPRLMFPLTGNSVLVTRGAQFPQYFRSQCLRLFSRLTLGQGWI